MSYEQVLFEVDEAGVAVITLSHPPHNAWNGTMAFEVSDAMRRCAADDAIRVVVLTGAGPRAFCAGVDMSDGGNPFNPGQAGDGAAPRQAAQSARGTYDPLYPYQLPKPVIAAINGHAIGIGITYPLLADVRFISEDAKVAFMFVRRGLVPELAAHAIVPSLCGVAVAAELLFSGKTISGKEAAALGLANHALPQAEVLPAALALAREMALNTSPAAVAASKRFLWESFATSVPELIKRENKAVFWLGRQPDTVEGITAYVQKREPKWTSRPSELPAELFE